MSQEFRHTRIANKCASSKTLLYCVQASRESGDVSQGSERTTMTARDFATKNKFVRVVAFKKEPTGRLTLEKFTFEMEGLESR